jgi:hypothetical protein
MQVKFSGFNRNQRELSGTREITITLEELIHASVTVGAPTLQAAIPNSRQALAFAFHKMFAMATIVEFDETGRISNSDTYYKLDQSEKVVLSYYMGMAMAKIIADRFLQVRWPVHARAMKDADRLTISPRRSRSLPDLIGQDSAGEWHVIEAKGYQKDPGKTKRSQWKKQAKKVRSIDTIPPVTKSYCLTLQQPRYSVYLVDPSGISRSAIDISIDPLALQKFYYAPYIDMFSEGRDIDVPDRQEILSMPMGFDFKNNKLYSIGILKRVLEQVIRNQPVEIPEIRVQNENGTYIGSDGIVIQSEPLDIGSNHAVIRHIRERA